MKSYMHRPIRLVRKHLIPLFIILAGVLVLISPTASNAQNTTAPNQQGNTAQDVTTTAQGATTTTQDVTTTQATTIHEENIRTGEFITLEEDEVLNKDFFAAGEQVRISGTVNGDVYAAGGQVYIDGTVNGDILTVGGTVEITGTTSQDIRVVGGQVMIAGEVGGSVSVAGGAVTIPENARVAGNLTAVAGTISLMAPIDGNLTAGVSNITAGGVIGGDALVATENINFLKDAAIAGSATIYTNATMPIDESKITGELSVKDLPQKPSVNADMRESTKNAAQDIFVFLKILSFMSALLIGLVTIHFFPRYSRQITRTLEEQPWKSLGVGFILAIISPFIVIALFITLIGIPISLLYIFLLAFSVYFAQIFIAFWIGQYVARKMNRTMNDGWLFLIGLVIFSLLKLIPVAGWIINPVATLAGLGAIIITKKAMYGMLRSKKLV